MELMTIFLRSIFIYFLVLVIMRIMGKREIGKLSVFDLVVSIMIADLSVIVIENPKISLWHGMVPIFTFVVAQILVSYVSMKSAVARHWIDGQPTVLIQNGNILEKAMRKNRYNVDDLMTQLRERNIDDLADVEYAILETTGKLSVFPIKSKDVARREDVVSIKDDHYPLAVPLIIDSEIQHDSLSKINQDAEWLRNELKRYGVTSLQQVFFASIGADGKLYIDLHDA
ncbi:DUF421 domain-containing protein [Mechercharimyces sp. CAU 1602]|uniref:DUF421 domain-containing protein n=1 Tax=Mechercharimyces sp. CAU 1602 TaxID=2973933 RepID=UPI0021634576|nr:DUF421 domain-containing protein [Mechercharimyces sp. CAU 1602]MCS1350681.1 DUF421 domain-containing protein [Mechercharimyces sp. CAU 1602]